MVADLETATELLLGDGAIDGREARAQRVYDGDVGAGALFPEAFAFAVAS